MKEEEVAELFNKIKKYIKSVGESIQKNDLDNAIATLNKANIVANYGSATILYKSISED